MKKHILFIVLLPATLTMYAQNKGTKHDCKLGETMNKNFFKAPSLDSVMMKYTSAGIPGAAIAVYTETEGWWSSAQGFASLELKTPMQNCHLQYLPG